jgi:hypothetical protein
MATYKPLQSIALTAATSSVTFSGIDQGYTDLVIVVNGTCAASVGLALRFNGDTSSNYSNTYLGGTGSSAITDRALNTVIGRFGNINTSNTTAVANIQDYSNTTRYKTTLGRSSSTEYAISYVNLWRSTNAITSVTVISDDLGTNFAVGTTFSLYGIKSGAPQALGGDVVTTDGNYNISTQCLWST